MGPVENTHPWLTFTINLSRAPARLWGLLGECNALCRAVEDSPLPPGDHSRLVTLHVARSARIAAGADGLSLTDDEISRILDGSLDLPPSRRYIAQGIRNMATACDRIVTGVRDEGMRGLHPRIIKECNMIALDRLVLPGGTVAGVFRSGGGPPLRAGVTPPDAGQCGELVERLCEWMNSRTFEPPPGMDVFYGLIKAVVAHLYLTWIQSFPIGNRRTTQLVEYYILVSAGIHPVAAHLLSAHYAATGTEYDRQLAQVTTPDGKVQQFIRYAVQGFRDGLRDMYAGIRAIQADALWRLHIREAFGDSTSASDLRRRALALEMTRLGRPVPLPMLQKASPAIAATYARLTYKTLTRDVQDLINMSLLEKTPGGLRIPGENVLALRHDTRLQDRGDGTNS